VSSSFVLVVADAPCLFFLAGDDDKAPAPADAVVVVVLFRFDFDDGICSDQLLSEFYSLNCIQEEVVRRGM
jgi:hypothetical protein